MARRIAQGLGSPLEALVVGVEARPLVDGLSAHGAEFVHLATMEGVEDYTPGAWARALVELARARAPQAVLAAGTDRGAEVMARAAAILEVPLAANCVAVEPGDPWVVTRQRWGGTLLEEAEISGDPRLMTVAPHAVQADETPQHAPAEVMTFTPALESGDLTASISSRRERGGAGISLSEAKVVVGGGRGVGGAEGFGVLEELADLLGGTVGCSRVATSAGWRPHADQIGQTGTRIAPDLYVACGISGATQHIVGCKGAKRILVINSDPEAPILAHADYAVIGDLHQVIPAIIDEIKKTRSN